MIQRFSSFPFPSPLPLLRCPSLWSYPSQRSLFGSPPRYYGQSFSLENELSISVYGASLPSQGSDLGICPDFGSVYKVKRPWRWSLGLKRNYLSLRGHSGSGFPLNGLFLQCLPEPHLDPCKHLSWWRYLPIREGGLTKAGFNVSFCQEESL